MTVADFMDFPFTPKSTANLRFGDYWAIQREDSQFGFLAFLKPKGPGRTRFIACVLQHVQPDEILQVRGSRLDIHRWGVIKRIGLIHVKTFQETSTEIIGNVAERLPVAEIAEAYDAQKTTINVWGYRTPIKLVNEIAGS